jgi:cation diffusion facilitator family transporter
MHEEVLRGLKFEHGTPPESARSERRTWIVVVVTMAMMVGELATGLWSGSTALQADGWHMATHAGAIALAGFAYWFARTRARAARFTFGTGKVYALAGWTNGLVLVAAGGWMVVESAVRLVRPIPIRFEEALPVAVLGLLVNLVCAWLLRPAGEAGDAHEHGHSHAHHAHEDHAAALRPHRDLNLSSAYLHVLVDLLTSVTAVVALFVGGRFGWVALDPVMGLLGGVVVLRWSLGLLRESGQQLLDLSPTDEALTHIRARLETIDDVRVADIHVWELGFGQRACLVSLVTGRPLPADTYRRAVLEVAAVDHLTVEVHLCPHPCG